MTDFADYPKSISEIKSDKTQDGGDWTPRDALISMLRDIDSGELSPDFAILIFGKLDENDATHTYFANATPNRYILMGLLEDFKRRLIVKELTGEF